jgi:hypothetical protein
MEIPQVIDSILQQIRIEELAVKMGKSVGAIYKWRTGKNIPDRGDDELLRKIFTEVVK